MLVYFCPLLYIFIISEFYQHHPLESPLSITHSSFPLHWFLIYISAWPAQSPSLGLRTILPSRRQYTLVLFPFSSHTVLSDLHFCQRDQWKLYARLWWVTWSLSLMSLYLLCLYWPCFTLGMMVFFFTCFEELFICKEYFFVVSCKYFFQVYICLSADCFFFAMWNIYF